MTPASTCILLFTVLLFATSTIADVNLTPGMFFPNSNNNQASINNDNCIPTSNQNSQGSQIVMNSSGQLISTPNQLVNSQTTPVGSNQNIYQPNQLYYPQNNGMISPYTTQPPNNNTFANPCDDSLERDKFKQCVATALKSLRAILENCRKTLGENAKECCLSDQCLESLQSSSSKENKERVQNERNHDGDYRSFRNDDIMDNMSFKKADTLDDFINFLELKLNARRDDYNNRRRNFRDYEDNRRYLNQNRENKNFKNTMQDEYSENDPYISGRRSDDNYWDEPSNRSRRRNQQSYRNDRGIQNKRKTNREIENDCLDACVEPDIEC